MLALGGDHQGSSGEAMAAQGGTEFGTTASNSGEEDKGRMQLDEGDRSFGGNRWPRQETLALLKIRSDMDAVFRDSNPKGPLWEDVSRKLAELGYHRSAKKCKEKFENVYKYHKRTKEGKTGRSESKNYKFFDQLQALEKLHSNQHSPPPNPQTPMPTTTAAALPWTTTNVSAAAAVVPNINMMPKMTNINPTTINSTIPPNSSINPTTINTVPSLFQHNVNQSHMLFSTSASSSSTASEESGGSSKRKRKWKEFFKRLTKEAIEKQEELQRKFLEAVEKQENQRTAREEAWRVQEMARINREHEVLVHERSTAAAKDAAVIAFLQKFTGQQNANNNNNINVFSVEKLPPSPYQAPPQQQVIQLQTPLPQQQPQQLMVVHNGGSSAMIPSPSRWPKEEVEALIKLRTSLDTKYQDGPKAPLWEEISAGMRRMGYNRNAKRCKEKWENINKYFKKVKESNKKRPEDSKTCPYFHQLDAIYREKGKTDISNMVPLLVQPEQQWPPPRENENLNLDTMQEEEEDEGDTDQEEEEEEGGYEMVTNKVTE